MEASNSHSEVSSLLELCILTIEKLRLLSPHLKPIPLTMSSITNEYVATQELLIRILLLPVVGTTSRGGQIQSQIGKRLETLLFGCGMTMAVVDEYVEELVQHASGAATETLLHEGKEPTVPVALISLWKEEDMKELVLQIRGYQSRFTDLIVEASTSKEAQEIREELETSSEVLSELVGRSSAAYHTRPNSMRSWDPGSIYEPSPPYAISLHEETRGYAVPEPLTTALQVSTDHVITSRAATRHLDIVDLGKLTPEEHRKLHQESVDREVRLRSQLITKGHAAGDPTAATNRGRSSENHKFRKPLDPYKVVILGLAGTEKSSLAIQFIHSIFVDRYDPTLEDSYERLVEVDGEDALVEILDTAGLEQFTALEELWMKDGEGFVLVYSITSTDSFDEIRKLQGQIDKAKEIEQWPRVLVGHNCDRVAEREVSTEEGYLLAKDLGCEFYEVSSKLRVNVDETFKAIVRSIRLHDSRWESQVQALSVRPPTKRDLRSWWTKFRRYDRERALRESRQFNGSRRKIDKIMEESSEAEEAEEVH